MHKVYNNYQKGVKCILTNGWVLLLAHCSQHQQDRPLEHHIEQTYSAYREEIIKVTVTVKG